MRNLLCFAQKKGMYFSFVLLLLSGSLLAQVTVSGKITGADGKGIPFVSVQIKNTTIGSASGADGAYSFDANVKPGNYTLVFSGVGLKTSEQSFTVGTGKTVTADAVLTADALNMDEVVVTGTSAGTTKKQLGSYVSTVKADQLNKGATGNVLAALQGKTAGAQIIRTAEIPVAEFLFASVVSAPLTALLNHFI